MQLGAGVELATMVVPHFFLPLACAANVAKVIGTYKISPLLYHKTIRHPCNRVLRFTVAICAFLECCGRDFIVNQGPHLQSLCTAGKHWRRHSEGRMHQ